MKNDRCGRNKTLAHIPGYRVDHCECGLFHICIGPVTVHMEPDAFLTFAEVVTDSVKQVLAEASKPKSMMLALSTEVAES